MKIAILAPVAWRTPPRKYGPWEQVASNITERLVDKGYDVTLFATGDSITRAKLQYSSKKGYEEAKNADPKVEECMHISLLMEQAGKFDIIHNHFDFLPLTYSRLIDTPMVTTIHGFSSPRIIPVYKKYNNNSHYVSISYADRSPELNYIANVYNGINTQNFTLNRSAGDYLLYFGRIHHDKGCREAIEIALKANKKLIIAGFIQDEKYFREQVKPFIDGIQISYVGNANPAERDNLLRGAYVLLHPINFQEPFGLSVAESMFCGTPVIAFNKGSMKELIKHGETGFLVDNVREAADVLPRVSELNRTYCREWAESRFSLNIMTDEYINVYHKVLEQSQHSSTMP
ncbi:MAG: glycosyltransferase family 4 protein [Bacteroidales bacterium]